METNIFDIRLNDVQCDIEAGYIECTKRGLLHSVKWLAELKHGLDVTKVEADGARFGDPSDRLITVIRDTYVADIAHNERNRYEYAKSLFNVNEYERAAYFISNAESPVPKFLHMYALYMGKEKRRLDNMTDMSNLSESGQTRDQSDLLVTLKRLHGQRKLDGYCLYLYGIVLKKLDLKEMAVTVLVEAINAAPMLWGAYVELTPLLSNKEHLQSLNLPNHWMKTIFIAHAYIELFLNDEGLKMFEDLQAAGFTNCTYITAQMAQAYHNKRSKCKQQIEFICLALNYSFFFLLLFLWPTTDVEKAIQIFQHLQEIDPYRLDNLDVFSNLLFVKEMKKEMAELAHKAVEINKYRPETCCVIGNYLSNSVESFGLCFI